MSRVEIYKIRTKDKQIVWEGDANNAWQGCMYIWRSLEQKYLPSLPPFPWTPKNEEKEYYSRVNLIGTAFGSEKKENPLQEIWNLVMHPDLTWDERIVMQTTFDRGYIAYADIPEVAAAYENVDFSNDNMKQQAEIFRRIYEEGKDGSVFGIIKNENSVCSMEEQCRYDAESEQMFLDDEKNWDYMAELRTLRDNNYKISEDDEKGTSAD